MKLSAEQFAELAATFNAQPTTGSHERRRAARTELQAQVKISMVISGRRLQPTFVTVCDFSARGVAFINATAMESGRQFVLELPRRDGGPVALLCAVRHTDSIGHHVFRIGAEFVCTIQPSQPHSDSTDRQEVRRIRESMLD